jgi:glycosyltransferase involved in cell wall biosynthesis
MRRPRKRRDLVTRIAVVWPKPRATRWKLGRTAPAEYPDLSDGFLHLEEYGFDVAIEDSLPWPWNPLVDHDEFYSALDPLRAARIIGRLRRYDAVVCMGDATAFVLLAARSLLKLRLPIILVDPALGGNYPRRKRLQDYVLPRADRVVVYGRVQLDYLREQYASAVKAVFLHFRADTGFYRPESHVNNGRSGYAFSIGLDGGRDFATLSAAAYRFSTTPGVDQRVVLQTTRPVSDPNGSLDIQSKPVSYTRLRDLYANASVVVVPLHDSRHPGGITTLMEAMAMARPIVVSASSGIIDYVRDGCNAIVVPPGDADAMSRAMAKLVRSPEEAHRLGRNGRQFVAEHCDNRVYARQLAAVIGDVIAGR